MAEQPQGGGPPDPILEKHSSSPSTSSTANPGVTASAEVTQTRGRRRSNTIVGENPFETPISSQDAEIARLIQTINHQYQKEEKNKTAVRKPQFSRQRTALVDDNFAGIFVPQDFTPFPSFNSTLSARQPIVEAPVQGDIESLPATAEYLSTSNQTLRQALGLTDLEYEADTESKRRPIDQRSPGVSQQTRTTPPFRSSEYNYFSSTQGIRDLPLSGTQGIRNQPFSGTQRVRDLPFSSTQGHRDLPLSGTQGIRNHLFSSTQGIRDLPLSGARGIRDLPPSSTQGIRDLPLSSTQGIRHHPLSGTQGIRDLPPYSPPGRRDLPPPPSPRPQSGFFEQAPPLKRVKAHPSLTDLNKAHLEAEKLDRETLARKQKIQRKIDTKPKMSYQGYDSAGAGQSNPRQAPPSPSQGMNLNHNNGMNGMGMNPGMIGYPTPAGHQADLNFIMSQVEELSRILRANEAATGNILDKVGQVQEKAKRLNLNNDEILALAADSLAEDTKNLETELAAMTKRLEKAERDRDANWKLVMHGCAILADLRDKMHDFKARHEAETLSWHSNYRSQLAFERAQNMELNNQINNMRAAACRANGHLRDLRRHLTDHPELHELRVQNHQYRKERRFYKRMAFKLMPEDDSEFSDDDDLRDPKLLKIRRAKEAKDREEEEREGDGAAGGQAA